MVYSELFTRHTTAEYGSLSTYNIIELASVVSERRNKNIQPLSDPLPFSHAFQSLFPGNVYAPSNVLTMHPVCWPKTVTVGNIPQ